MRCYHCLAQDLTSAISRSRIRGFKFYVAEDPASSMAGEIPACRGGLGEILPQNMCLWKLLARMAIGRVPLARSRLPPCDNEKVLRHYELDVLLMVMFQDSIYIICPTVSLSYFQLYINVCVSVSASRAREGLVSPPGGAGQRGGRAATPRQAPAAEGSAEGVID